ncbi:hypothetical protein C5B42_03680 [Candidatus Cerribacteria bacterium 'Amazon FNV 2010 28 9']|uniref:DUF4012 domain-containing protein n=1 Tax=Candidatus Cerribacteria bacterium 'Amazon FNV 2010 28 9' TaxID=2081795 RepID=A0A317JPQ6_9BACT|nr:MAG: hypothetical protein C5B42_03680 [Candidatus Cerribacteria bacterium 'Amazon FNV 2010 28 9']
MKKIRTLFIAFMFILSSIVAMLIYPAVRAGYSFFGFDHPKEYIVLFQNNMELRSTGGFMGSFGRIGFEKGKMSVLKIQDIYVPDGQLDGHVDPPWPIQAAFGQGWYRLRDSNFDPDFPTSAQTIEWFFEHGGEKKSDGIIAVNLSLLREILKVTGPVHILDQIEPVTVDNFYAKTQAAADEGFFPGSTQKTDFLSKLGSAVLEQLHHLRIDQYVQLANAVRILVKQKQILFAIDDAMVASFFHSHNMDGALARSANEDYVSFFENNFGANKANCCIKRTVNVETSKRANVLEHVVTLSYINTNPSTLKQPPQFWGGAYVNFLRVAIPIQATIQSISVNGSELPSPSVVAALPNEEESDTLNTDQTIEDLMAAHTVAQTAMFGVDTAHRQVLLETKQEQGIQLVGFFVFVDALSSSTVQIQYTTPVYSTLHLQKQSGVDEIPYMINGKKVLLKTDTTTKL